MDFLGATDQWARWERVRGQPLEALGRDERDQILQATPYRPALLDGLYRQGGVEEFIHFLVEEMPQASNAGLTQAELLAAGPDDDVVGTPRPEMVLRLMRLGVPLTEMYNSDGNDWGWSHIAASEQRHKMTPISDGDEANPPGRAQRPKIAGQMWHLIPADH